MPKKLPYTPTSRIKNDLRRLWLRSRERAAAVKREANTCQHCGKKGSVARGREVAIEVHHTQGIRWDEIVEYIRMRLLIDPCGLEVFCKECHGEIEDKKRADHPHNRRACSIRPGVAVGFTGIKGKKKETCK